jgi:hypothetical protein
LVLGQAAGGKKQTPLGLPAVDYHQHQLASSQCCSWLFSPVVVSHLDPTVSFIQANLGTARLLVKALQQQGVSAGASKAGIWMIDSKGLILASREGLTAEKAEFAQDASGLVGNIIPVDSNNPRGAEDKLAAIVAAVRPTALIGAAAVAGAFGQPVIEELVQV